METEEPKFGNDEDEDLAQVVSGHGPCTYLLVSLLLVILVFPYCKNGGVFGKILLSVLFSMGTHRRRLCNQPKSTFDDLRHDIGDARCHPAMGGVDHGGVVISQTFGCGLSDFPGSHDRIGTAIPVAERTNNGRQASWSWVPMRGALRAKENGREHRFAQ